MVRLTVVLVVLSGCTSTLTLRASSSDFLKLKATTLSLTAPPAEVTAMLNTLFFERGFRPSGTSAGDNGTKVYFYKGSRPVPPQVANSGIQVGSWFAAKVATVDGFTNVFLLGKPLVGSSELCSESDELLREVKYTCSDSKVPAAWAGVNLVSGRDETEVVSWVLTGLYERLKR